MALPPLFWGGVESSEGAGIIAHPSLWEFYRYKSAAGSLTLLQARLVLLPGQDQGLLIVVDGLVDPAASGQSDAEVLMGFGVVGLDFQGLLEMGHRRVDRPRPQERRPDCVGLGVVGLDFRAFRKWAIASSIRPRSAKAAPRLMWASA